jgi:hypothetical protein
MEGWGLSTSSRGAHITGHDDIGSWERRKTSFNLNSHARGDILAYLSQTRVLKDRHLRSSLHSGSKRDLAIPHNSHEEIFRAEGRAIVFVFWPKDLAT